jgi:hypothetical protein
VTSDKVLSFNRKLSDVNNLLVEYGKRVNTYVDYQLTIQTIPGGALFEGTLRFDEEMKKPVGISFKRFSSLSIGFIFVFEYRVQNPTSSAEFYEYQTALSTVYYSLVDFGANLSLCENLSLSEVKYASRLVTSDKVLSLNRKLSDVNNLLVEYRKRVVPSNRAPPGLVCTVN